jgi:hypothetical protein
MLDDLLAYRFFTIGEQEIDDAVARVMAEGT